MPATTYGAVEEQEMAELRQTVSMVFLTALLAVPVGMGLVAALTLMITRYQRSLVRQTSESARLALHDPLTGLPNRALFADRLAQALAAGRRDGTGLAVMLLDLDRFKEVNDTLGHGYGDELLRQMAVRLSASLREADTVARLSGDEFAVLLPGADAAVGDRAGRTGPGRPAPQLRAATTSRSMWRRASAWPWRRRTATRSRRSCAAPTSPCTRPRTPRPASSSTSRRQLVHQPNRLVLLGDLRRALDEPDQLVLYYQPKISLDVNQVCGVEALVRWNHPTRGTGAPGRVHPRGRDDGPHQPAHRPRAPVGRGPGPGVAGRRHARCRSR